MSERPRTASPRARRPRAAWARAQAAAPPL